MFKYPPVIFLLVWLSVLLLAAMDMSYLIIPLRTETVTLVVTSSLLMFLGFFLCLFIFNLSIKNVDEGIYFKIFSRRKFERRLGIVFYFWLFGSAIELIYSGNLPLVSAFGIGRNVRYTEYGIPGFHGLMNSIYFLLVVVYFSAYLITHKKKYLVIFIFTFILQTFQLSRMILMASILQSIFVYLLIRSVSVRTFLKITFLLLATFWLFGVLGDLRTGRDAIIGLANLKIDYPDWMPSFIIWVYIYIVSPINNINSNIDVFNIGFIPYNSLSQVLPSFFRGEFSSVNDEFELVATALNVNSLFYPLLLDFGKNVAPFFFFFAGFASAIVSLKSRYKPQYFVASVIFLYTILQSVFANHMIHIVFISEFILAALFFRGLNARD